MQKSVASFFQTPSAGNATSRHTPASVFSRAEQSGRAAAHFPACTPCRCELSSSLMPAHGLAYVSSFHFSISNPNFSLYSVESTTTNYKATSFSQASQFSGNTDFYGMNGQNYFPFDKEKPMPEPWLPTAPRLKQGTPLAWSLPGVGACPALDAARAAPSLQPCRAPPVPGGPGGSLSSPYSHRSDASRAQATEPSPGHLPCGH